MLSKFPTGAHESPTFEVMLQDRELSRLKLGVVVETVHVTIQSGTVTLVPAITDVDPIEVPPAEINVDAPTCVSHMRISEVCDFPCMTPRPVLLFAFQLLT